jgi:transposase
VSSAWVVATRVDDKTKLVPLKPALERHLGQRWQDLFAADTQVLLYDLTSTYFEGTAAGVEQATHGYSRDHRPDCRQVVAGVGGHDRGVAADLPAVLGQHP